MDTQSREKLKDSPVINFLLAEKLSHLSNVALVDRSVSALMFGGQEEQEQCQSESERRGNPDLYQRALNEQHIPLSATG